MSRRYSCWTAEKLPRGGRDEWVRQDGWTEDGRRNMVAGVTEWLPIACGHDLSSTDSACEGCALRRTK